MSDPSIGVVYLAYFAPRTDAYSVWNGTTWQAIREELTPDIAIAGLTRKGQPVSAYMITPENTSHVFGIDFDTPNGLAEAAKLQNAMADGGVSAFLEGSRRGAHLWGVIDRPLPALVVRRAIRAFLDDAHLPTDNPKIELRPGQDTIHPDEEDRPGLGTCLRMPMMPHPKTGGRWPLTGVGGEKLGDSITEILMSVSALISDPDKVIEASTRWVPIIRPGDIPRRYQPPKRPDEDDGSACDVLRDFWGVYNARPSKAVKCPAHDDQVPSLMVFRNDDRAMCMSPECILHNDGRGRGLHELRTMAPRKEPARVAAS